MIKKISRYLIVTIIMLISFFLISVATSKIIFENQFSLKTNDLRGYEELTSKVFIPNPWYQIIDIIKACKASLRKGDSVRKSSNKPIRKKNNIPKIAMNTFLFRRIFSIPKFLKLK